MAKVTVLHKGDKAFKRMLGVCNRDNTYSTKYTLMDYLVLKENEALYRVDNQLTPELLEMLAVFVKLFKTSNKAITSYVLTKLLNSKHLTGCNIVNTRQKLERLVKKGYAEILGKSGNSTMYIPTERAYKELSELIK